MKILIYIPCLLSGVVISIVYIYPLVMMLLNSFKRKAYISRAPFDLPMGGELVFNEEWS